MLADNSRHLVAAAHQRHDDAHQRAQEAIRVIAAGGNAVTATGLWKPARTRPRRTAPPRHLTIDRPSRTQTKMTMKPDHE